MATIGIKDISLADNYTGTPQLGASLDYAINIDSKPVEQLAQYTYLYNKAAYEQQQRDAEEQAAKLADLTAYDLNSAIPKDRELIQKQYDELYSYVQKNPTVLDYKNNRKGWLEYNKKKNDFTNNLKGAKTRSILYSARLEEVSKELDPANKKRLEDNLKKEAESTDLKTPLRVTQQYNDGLPKMPQATGIKVPVAKRNPNDIFDEEHELWNARAARDKGNVFALALDEVIDETTEEGKVKAIAKKNNFWLQGSEVFNLSISASKNADGSLDETKVKGVAKNLLDLAKKVNAYNANKVNEINSGTYGNTLRAEDYAPINYVDGISPDELAVIADFATWKGDNVSRKIVETNDASEAANRANSLKIARENEAGANYRARLAKDGKGKGGGKDELEVIDKPAFIFGQNVERTKAWFNKGNKDLAVKARSVDPYTKRAAGLKDDEEIVYYPDGSYIIRNEKTKEKISQNTVENLAQGYINAVKAIDFSSEDQKDAAMAEGFQLKSENKFKQIWGTSSGKFIWDNWGTSQEPPATSATSDNSGSPAVPKGAVIVYSKKTGEALGYELNGKKYKF